MKNRERGEGGGRGGGDKERKSLPRGAHRGAELLLVVVYGGKGI